MKLYLWEGVLTDYSDGLAFAVAETLDDALDSASKLDGEIQEHIRDQLAEAACHVVDIYDGMTPIGAYVYGGG